MIRSATDGVAHTAINPKHVAASGFRKVLEGGYDSPMHTTGENGASG